MPSDRSQIPLLEVALRKLPPDYLPGVLRYSESLEYIPIFRYPSIGVGPGWG
jgi:hypothetical protein